jgi:hypothetical protein
MVATIHLNQEAGLRHALPAAPMAWGPAAARAGETRRAQEPLHRWPGQGDAVVQPEQLGEMVVVRAGICRPDEREDLSAYGSRQSAVRGPSAVPMGHGSSGVAAEAGQEATQMPHGRTQQSGRFSGPEDPTLQSGEDVHAVLLLLVQGDRLLGHAPRVTESLNR